MCVCVLGAYRKREKERNRMFVASKTERMGHCLEPRLNRENLTNTHARLRKKRMPHSSLNFENFHGHTQTH